MKFIVLTSLLSAILGAALEPVPGTDKARLQVILPDNLIFHSFDQVGAMEEVVARLFFLAEEQRLGALADVDTRIGNLEQNIDPQVQPIVVDYIKKLTKALEKDPLLVFQIELFRDDQPLPANTPAVGFLEKSMNTYTQLRVALEAHLGALQLNPPQLDEAMEYANLRQTKVLNEPAYEERHRITKNLGLNANAMPRTSLEAYLYLVQTQANKYKDKKLTKPADCVQRLADFDNNPQNYPHKDDIHKYHQLQVLGNVAKLLFGNIKQTDGKQDLENFKIDLVQEIKNREDVMKAWPGFAGHITTRRCIMENQFQAAVDPLLANISAFMQPPLSFQVGMKDTDSMYKHSLSVLHSIARFFTEAINIKGYNDGNLLPDTIRRAKALGEHWAAVLKGGNLPATPFFFKMLTSYFLDGPDAEEAAQSLMDNYVSLGGALLSTTKLDERYEELEHSVNLLPEAHQVQFGKLVFAEVLKRHDPTASFGRAIGDFLGQQGQQGQQQRANDEILIRPYLALFYSGLMYKVEMDHVSTQKKDIASQGIDCTPFKAPRKNFKSHVSKMVLYSIIRDGSRFLERLGVVARKDYLGLATQDFEDFEIVTDGTALIVTKAAMSLKYVTDKYQGFGQPRAVCTYYAALFEAATALKTDAQARLDALQAVNAPDVKILAIGQPDIGNHPDPYSNVSTEKINISGEGNSNKDSGDEAVQVQETGQTVNASESAPTATTSSKSAAPMSIETSQALGLLTAVAAGFVVLFA